MFKPRRDRRIVCLFSRILQAIKFQFLHLKASRDGAAATSLASLFHQLITLIAYKEVFVMRTCLLQASSHRYSRCLSPEPFGTQCSSTTMLVHCNQVTPSSSLVKLSSLSLRGALSCSISSVHLGAPFARCEHQHSTRTLPAR